MKGNETRDYLVQCRKLIADATISNAATKKNDSRILALLLAEILLQLTIIGHVTEFIPEV